ncbi:MAG: hypothetical protein MR739_06570 [Spirochaetia bacterium]|nr:hypothetical protein [Spirochaetia bacterium]
MRYRFIPSLRFGTGYASPYNPCHCLKLKNSKLNLLIKRGTDLDYDNTGLSLFLPNIEKNRGQTLRLCLIICIFYFNILHFYGKFNL